MLTTATSHLGNYCVYCEQNVPPGCGHQYGGDDKKCPLGPATDPKRIVGLAILKAMEGRKSIADSLNHCDRDIRLEVIDVMGQAALDAAVKLKAL